MSQKDSNDSAGQGHAPNNDQRADITRMGSGAASALERMKAEHALRHTRQHGRQSSAGTQDEDPSSSR
jgi:hypothetical protein